ncbi:MAG: hypothetical protein RL708_2735, partial [Bacteroidota bacterium]
MKSANIFSEIQCLHFLNQIAVMEFSNMNFQVIVHALT